MKLLFINLYGKKIRRGAESFTHRLGEELGKTHEVSFLEGDSGIMPLSTFNQSFFGNILKRLFLDKAGREVLLFSLFSVIPVIVKERPEVVFPLNGFWQVLLLKILQPLLRYKIIITGHSGPGWDERWNLYLKPDFFVATTPETQSWAQQTCSWTIIVMIPLAIDIESFRNPSKAQPLALQKPIILTVAALVAYKRIHLIIEAMKHMTKGSLLVIGYGPEKTVLETQAKILGLERFAIISVPYEQMPSYYAMADVFTLASSEQESFGMVYMEAMAAGKPIVTTDAPRPRWIVQEAGIFVDPIDSQAYAVALEGATHMNTHVAAKKSLERFDWRVVTGAYEQLLETLS